MFVVVVVVVVLFYSLLRLPKGAFVRWAMQLLSVTVQRGTAEMYRRSGLVISREQGLRYDAGFAVPVLMS